MREIGSEFERFSNQIGRNTVLDRLYGDWDLRFVLSGRTAISLVIRQLRRQGRIRSAALPAYCCAAMIQPFTEAGIAVSFYTPADPEPGIRAADTVLVMDYFGFIRTEAARTAKLANAMGKTVIADLTQSFFSASPVCRYADYMVASLRKWSDLLCGVALAKTAFPICADRTAFSSYQKLWRAASDGKRAYLTRNQGEKEVFLSQYRAANELLAGNNRYYAAAPEEVQRVKTLDERHLVAGRRENAAFLLDRLRRMEQAGKLELMFSHLEQPDCPLFVPILLDPAQRGPVRAYLTAHEIYCPLHWPPDRSLPFCETERHRRELSLICDQRYGLRDMEREIDTLEAALNGDG